REGVGINAWIARTGDEEPRARPVRPGPNTTGIGGAAEDVEELYGGIGITTFERGRDPGLRLPALGDHHDRRRVGARGITGHGVGVAARERYPRLVFARVGVSVRIGPGTVQVGVA